MQSLTFSRTRSVPTLFLLGFLFSGCATTTNSPNLTPVARNAYNLTQLVDAIGILQTSAEASVPNKVLPVNTARLIVQFCVAANTTIGQVPNGWVPVVKTAYATTKSQLTPDELNKFAGYLSAFEIILNSF